MKVIRGPIGAWRYASGGRELRVRPPERRVARMLWLTALAVFGVLLAVTAAISASPIAVGVLAGAALGAILFLVPRVALWLCVIGALLVAGAISLFAPSLNKLTWLFSMLGFFLFAAALLKRLAQPTTGHHEPTPIFVWLALVFFVYALAVSPLSGSTAGELIAGTKRSFQFWGLLFAGAWLFKEPRDNARLLKFLGIVALLQLPLALYQRIVLVPMRVGLGQGVVPVDVVSGTFEATLLAGGNSSGMVLFLTIVAVVLVSAWREGVIGGWRSFVALAWVLVPMGLGETKVVIVFLPVVLAILFGQYVRRAPVASIAILISGLALTALLFWIYATYYGRPGYSLAQKLQATIDYNFGQVGYYGAYSLNRTTALKYWWQNHGGSNPVELFFGHGLGSSYAAPTALVQGHVAAQHRFIGIGFSAASSILWELGAIGLLLYGSILWAAWRAASRLLRAVKRPWERAVATGLRCSVPLFALMTFYSDSLLNALSVQCLMMLCLGAIARAPVRRAGIPTPPPAPASAARV